MSGETIAAVATAPGRAGVAVVRVSGEGAFALAGRLTGGRVTRPSGIAPQACVCSLYEADSDGGRIDDAVVLAFRSPHSYTGEDVVEFQCHGGIVTPRRVLEACFAAGARLARRGEFTERAFLNGKLDYDQAESVLDLIEAKTSRAADVALDGISGGRERELRTLYDLAVALSAEIEHALDIDEGELPDSFFVRVRDGLIALDGALSAALVRIRARRMLRDGATVVLSGPPNAGKSSLFNALVGECRAIVSDVPGTTRDVVEAWVDFSGWPVRLVDTAGLCETDDPIESEGVRRAERMISEADVVVDLSSTGARPLGTATASVVRVHAKSDLERGEGLNVSAKTGDGITELKETVASALEERAAAAGDADQGAGDVSGLSSLISARAMLSPVLLAVSEHPTSLDIVLAGNAVRGVAEALGETIGATYSDGLLDALFARFCVGK